MTPRTVTQRLAFAGIGGCQGRHSRAAAGQAAEQRRWLRHPWQLLESCSRKWALTQPELKLAEGGALLARA